MKCIENGIVLARSPYSETSLIVQILTENHGLQSFLFQGAKKKKGMLLFPLALVEITYYKRSDSGLGKLTELQHATVLDTLPFDPVKSSIAFFIAELVQRTLRQGHEEKLLYNFLHQEIIWINHSAELSNYLSWFLGQYSIYLGITPNLEQKNPSVFDIQEGKLSNIRPLHPAYFEGAWVQWFARMFEVEKHEYLSHNICRAEKNLLFDAWMAYFQQHLNGLKEIKSVEVIRAVLYT